MRFTHAVLTTLLLCSSSPLWADHEYDSPFSRRDAAVLQTIVDLGSILRGQAPVYSSAINPGSRYPSGFYNAHQAGTRSANAYRKEQWKQHPRGTRRSLPPGLVKRGKPLPPGWQKKLHAGMTLPEGWKQHAKPAPAYYYDRIAYSPGTELIEIDRQIARIASDTRLVVDVLDVLTGR